MVLFVLIVLLAVIAFATYFNLQNFPAPTGSFAVGVTEVHVIDTKRKETNAPGAARELMLHVWYPAGKTNIQKKSDVYNADAMENIQEFMSKKSGMPQWIFAGLPSTKVYETLQAPIGLHQYPVIIMSHGAGPMVQQYTWLGQELASHGYIVVGINHTYMAAVTKFPDGRVIKSLLHQKKKEGKHVSDAWKAEQRATCVADIQFVLDYLKMSNEDQLSFLYHKLDLARIGVCGHSFGGTVAMQVCQQDARVKAGICMDQGFKGKDAKIPLLAPVLNLMAEKSHAWQGARGAEERQELIELSKQKNSKMQLVSIKDVGHAGFLDVPLLMHATVMTQLLSRFIDIDVNASSAQACKAIVNIKSVIVAFFAEHLKGNIALQIKQIP